MEKACWGCGDINHHFRECPNSKTPTYRREIQKFRAAVGQKKLNKVPYEEKMNLIKRTTDSHLLPVIFIQSFPSAKFNKIVNKFMFSDICDQNWYE